jgi:5-methyltetrahydrofolate--homocysteine methyltransferase
MTDLREALVALECLKAEAPALPVLVSMTFQRKKRGFFTLMGDPLARALKALVAAGAAAVGANCTLTSADMKDLASEARASVDAPLVLQPNAGLPEVQGDALLYSQEPAAFADDMAAVAELGIQAVGGCCGTDPRFIRALAARLGHAERR